MFVFKAAVVGAGTMGGQIAQTIAAAGIPVILKDIKQELVDAGLAEARNATAGQLKGKVEKGKLSQEDADAIVDDVCGRISGALEYDGFGDVDFVIEAVPERMDVKHAVFAELDAVTPGHAILASNTSGLSITEIGEATLRPDKVVGFHYFFPASVMPLVEIVESGDTSAETIQATVTFAQAIKKQPIVCAEVPGFVVNRILLSGIAEVLRDQEEKGLDIKQIDDGLKEAKALPMGPFKLFNMLGLDPFQHTCENLADAYGDRFYVSEAVAALVGAGKLGAKTPDVGGAYAPDGSSQLPGDQAPDIDEIAEKLSLKMLVESCALLQEGVATHRDIDTGMMGGAGLDPRRGILPPFMKADEEGLDAVLERLEHANEEWGERFAPPRILRRLVAQGRLGKKSGQGFYPYPAQDAESFGEGTVLVERRDKVALCWLANPPMNSVSPQFVADMRKAYDTLRGEGIRAIVITSSNPALFSAGADIKAFTTLDEAGGRAFVDDTQALFRDFAREDVATVAAVNGLTLGGGNELAMACDVRIAAQSALFGQPEVKLGLIPGFAGTQRLPRLVGENKALELNLVGDPIPADEAYEYGMVNRLVIDHELLDVALGWARKLAEQAPLAVRWIKQVSAQGDLDAGIEAEKQGFSTVFNSEDGREGVSAFLAKRPARWSGR